MKITSAKVATNFRIQLLFDNAVSGIVDLSDLAGKGVFKVWMQPGFFEKVKVTPSGYLSWPGDLDLCPDSLFLKLSQKEPEEIFPLLNHHLAHA